MTPLSSDMVNPFKSQTSYLSWCMFALQTGLQTQNSMCLAYDDIHEHLLTDPPWQHLAKHMLYFHHMPCNVSSVLPVASCEEIGYHLLVAVLLQKIITVALSTFELVRNERRPYDAVNHQPTGWVFPSCVKILTDIFECLGTIFEEVV